MIDGNLVALHDEKWLARQKHAGLAVSSVLRNFAETVKSKPQKLTLKNLEEQSLQIIKAMNCSPTFLGYKGFPGAVCLSVNEVVVHGIPTDYQLQDGDVVTLDAGATFEGAIADAAFTCVYGQPKSEKISDMIKLCQKALNDAVSNVKMGNQLGIIGNTISKCVKDSGFGLITNHGGHGLNYNTPHCDPFVENKSRADLGIRMTYGLAIAIEPMLVLNKNFATKVLKDGWSVATKHIGVHFEHSVTLDGNGNQHIITDHKMIAEDYIW